MRTGAEIIIDASIELENIKPFFKSSPSAIFVTHTHRDHIAYIGSYINNFPEINIIGHPESKNNFDNNKFIPVSDGSKMKIGNLKIKAIFTPGHYFDSICYLVENILGWPLSQKTQAGFFRIGLFFLFSSMFFVTFNDLKDLGLF